MSNAKFTNATGTIALLGESIPSIDDCNDIIAHHTKGDSQFLTLCRISADWPKSLTVEEFSDRCKAVVAVLDVSDDEVSEDEVVAAFEAIYGRGPEVDEDAWSLVCAALQPLHSHTAPPR